MDSQSYNMLYSRIIRKLTGSKWLSKIGLGRNTVENFLKATDFKKQIEIMIEEKSFTCKNTLDACIALLNKLAGTSAPEKWLFYIYQYTLFKSFPDAVTIELDSRLDLPCEFYLRFLRVICEYEKTSNCGSWQSIYPLNFLTDEEGLQLEHPEEYTRFVKAFRYNYTYEMMKLNSEVYNFNTIDHICGVHFLSMYIARQLKSIGLPVDLGRVSGSAAGHDIGKYGCKKEEFRRVPYLHYYYTDQWFKKYKIDYIRNVALNHSTWDLELENLSLESLILIYSDFRVKNMENSPAPRMNIYSLKDSFDIILHKLDNVTDMKVRRYKRVYAKLKDFQEYIASIGVKTEIEFVETESLLPLSSRINHYSLMQGDEIVENLKYLSIYHNINLMYKLRDEYSLGIILEAARSENDWKNLRIYISILQEYSAYLTQSQKLQTIRFLYENLVHPEDDIRRHCAELLGTLIAIYDEEYRKEIPEHVQLEKPGITSYELLKEYIGLLLYPSQKLVLKHRLWISYCLSIMINSFFKHCRNKLISSYADIILDFYEESSLQNPEVRIFLLETAKCIPISKNNKNTAKLFCFILSMISKHSSSLRLSALETAAYILPSINDEYFINSIKNILETYCTKSKFPTENFIKYKLADLLNLKETKDLYYSYYKNDRKKIQEIFLSNLKTATDWVKKREQIDLLLQYSLDSSEAGYGLHTAIHFCNLLKVSAVESVRNMAGNAILKLMPSLTPAERNEVAVELLRAMEIEGNKFTEYIPKFTGEIILFLQPNELDEVIDDLSLKIKNANANIKSLILKTVGVTVSHYFSYWNKFDEAETNYNNRLIRLLGILLNGLGDYTLSVKQAAFNVIGKDIFGNSIIGLSQKVFIFKNIAKKILTLITADNNEELLFLTNAACLNHIYRFISDYSFFAGKIDIKIPEKVAFFPGTFDPFSSSHKAIATSIRDLGYEVYLYVDEFSWSKKTLPSILRENIVNMSIADELHIYSYPDDFPTNMANPHDLRVLKDNFHNSKVYIAVGSDVIINASAYMGTPEEDSIHTFPHIIFQRGNNKRLEEASKGITGEIQWLTLPQKYMDISSTQIRNSIDVNRDISSLVDPLAQNYIYENGFYQKEPQNKTLIKTLWLNCEIIDNFSETIINEISCYLKNNREALKNILHVISEKPSARVICIRNCIRDNELLAFSVIHWVRSGMIYTEMQDASVSKYIRENSIGRILSIDEMFAKPLDTNMNIEQVLLTETLAFAISKDYEYAVYKPMGTDFVNSSFEELLKLQGFIDINDNEGAKPVYVVNMSSPCVLNLDIENILKEPFISNAKISRTICSTRKKLQQALTALYPGELILSFDSNMLHQKMIRKICEENNVSTEISVPRNLGKAMCVPYGDILDRFMIPNTVTKALHTEKLFQPDTKSFFISQFPYYLDLKTQVSMIKSFDRPVILVDNILHKGYRMKALDPLFKKEKIHVQKILAGILSGRGKDLMDIQGREVDSVYFIPKLKIWFNENALYPFIGGDALWRGVYPKRNLLPSINLIMPYTSASFISGTGKESVYNLSRVCLENSMSILKALESEYHLIHERNLSLSYLGQVFTIPRCPDHGKDMEFDLKLNPSHYIKNDLELLNRLEEIISR